MANARARVKAKVKRKPSKLQQLFYSQKAKTPKNFSSSLEYGNLGINIKNKAGIVKCNLKIESKNFSFAGIITLNEKSFNEVHYMVNQLLSSVRNIK